MEWKKSMSVVSVAMIWMLVVLSQISAFPAQQSASGSYSPEEYEREQTGLRELFEELERQGGLSGPMMPRSYYYALPNHQMARKSQRSNTLRLRFGKRSTTRTEQKNGDDMEAVMGGENPIP